MECLRCFDGTTGHAAENQNADRERLLQTRRCRKSLGRFRGKPLSIYNGAASNGTLSKNQNVDDQTEAAGARSMNTDSKDKILSGDGSRLATAEQRLGQLGIKLPVPPEPFGMRKSKLPVCTGMLPTAGREAKLIGRLGAELD